MRLAERMSVLGTETAFEVLAKARRLEAEGKDVIHLEIGEPDFNTPENIRLAAKKAMDEGFTKYTPGSGLLELRQAICKKLQRDNGIVFSPDQIIVSNGAKHSLSTACQVLLNPGDEAGFSVAGPGDVNYDGYDDMVVGAVSDDSGGNDGGASYLVFGPVSGSINLSSSDARLLGASGKTSWSVSAAGDVNADGYRDLFIGAYGGDNAAYLVLGGGL